jgi:hypothetical protein
MRVGGEWAEFRAVVGWDGDFGGGGCDGGVDGVGWVGWTVSFFLPDSSYLELPMEVVEVREVPHTKPD